MFKAAQRSHQVWMTVSKCSEETPIAELACSFCGKTSEQVRRLIAGPRVYICDECVDLCNEIIEREVERESGAGRPPAAAAVAVNLLATCVLCRLPKPNDELVGIPDRGFICAVCAQLVRDAFETQE